MSRNSRELLAAVADWLGNQHEDLSFGLKSAFDALRLYQFWTERSALPEFCDEDTDDDGNDLAALRIEALGYDPIVLGRRTETLTENAPTGVNQVLDAVASAECLLDSVAFVSKSGDTKEPLRRLRDVQEGVQDTTRWPRR